MHSKYVNKIKYATYILDKDFRITKCDDNFTDITGYTSEDICNKVITQQDLIMEEDREVYFEMVTQEFAKRKEAYIEHRIKKKNGKPVLVFCLGHVNIDKETGNEYSVIRIVDITKMRSVRLQEEAVRSEMKEKTETLLNKVNTDELTGLLRRGAFIKEVGRHISANDSFSMIMIDVDNFKHINDIYGHFIGDRVLVQLADVFKNTLRGDDVVCRMGGDEFALLLSGVKTGDKVIEIMKRVMRNISNIPVAAEEGFQVEISTGAKIYDSQSNYSFEELYIAADDALYRAKSSGKNCIKIAV